MLTWLDSTTWIVLAAEGPEAPFFLNPLWMLAIIGVMFYFLMIRPEKRKRADVASMQDSLKKNDRIVTIGGILGVVVNTQAGSNEVTIRVDDNTRIRVLRSSISRVITEEKSDQKKDDA